MTYYEEPTPINNKPTFPELIKKNKPKFTKYVLFPSLTALSTLPSIGFYLTKNAKYPFKILAISSGIILNVALIKLINEYKIQGTTQFENEKISIAYQYDFDSKQNIFNSPLIDRLGIISTNYGILKSIEQNPLLEKTSISIYAKNGEDKIECYYQTNGFKKIKDIKIHSITPTIKINDTIVTGDLSQKVYGGLCTQIFSKEKKHLTNKIKDIKPENSK